jgi:hypothetical protein
MNFQLTAVQLRRTTERISVKEIGKYSNYMGEECDLKYFLRIGRGFGRGRRPLTGGYEQEGC